MNKYKVLKGENGYAVFSRVETGFSGGKFFWQQVSKWYFRKAYAIKCLNKISLNTLS